MTPFPSRLTQQLPPSLTAKALLMTHYQPVRALAANIKLMLDAPVVSLISSQVCDAQLDLMNAWNAETDDELQDKLTMTQVPVGQQIRNLMAAPLAEKRIVLASMPIIDVFHAAGVLGITELALNHFNAFHHDTFGQAYMSQRHYSLDELMLIKSNPEWLSDYQMAPAPATVPMSDSPQFGRFTVVEEKVAMAFCNVTREELPKVATVARHNVSAFYLADLDKIRVAKLKAEQQ
jgi:hypothetical protein